MGRIRNGLGQETGRGGPVSPSELASRYNAASGRADTQWVVDPAGGLRLEHSGYVSDFVDFMRRAKARRVQNEELRRVPFRWLNIAEEHGYVRHVGDRRYEPRKDTGYELEPPRF